MTYNIGPLTVTPGIPSNNILKNAPAVQAIKLTNGTQFDLQFVGFGTAGSSICPAGLEYMLHASDGNDGYINLLPIDSLGVGGSGVVNMVVFLQGEDLPKGSWPATVPAQRVITPAGSGAVVADHLINTGNAGAGSPIINITEQGSTGYQLFADNQGNLIDSQYVSGVLTTIFRLIAGVAANQSNVLLSDANHQTEALGRFLVDNISNFQNIVYLNAPSQASQTGAYVGGFGGVGGTTGFLTGSSASDANFTSFWAQHTGAGAGNPQNSSGFRFSGDANTAFQPDINPFKAANGSVSGNAQLYCPIWGTGLKIGYLWLSNLNTATKLDFLFPSSTSLALFVAVGAVNTAQIAWYNGAVNNNVIHILTIGGAGATGTIESVSVLRSVNLGWISGVNDRVSIPTTGGNASNSFVLMIGI